MVTVGKRASGVAAQPTRKRLILGALCLCTPKGLAKIGDLREGGCRQTISHSRSAGMQTRLFQAGFCLWVLGVVASRKSGPYAPDCAHMTSLPDYFSPINPTGRNACAGTVKVAACQGGRGPEGGIPAVRGRDSAMP